MLSGYNLIKSFDEYHLTLYIVPLIYLTSKQVCFLNFSSVQSLSHVWLFATPWTAACQASLSITNSRVYSNSCPLSRWCHPTISSSAVPFSSCPQSFPASGSFQISALCIRWPKDWSFSFSIIPSKEHAGLISFRMDWLDLLAVQGALKSLLQHHSSKAQILLCCLLYGPTLISIHDYWKNHSFD